MMSDEEFNNLPNWSDVEDDPEYNSFRKNVLFLVNDSELVFS
jgi:hypothetical protein